MALARLSLAWTSPPRPGRSTHPCAVPHGGCGRRRAGAPASDDRVDPRSRRHSWQRRFAGSRPPHAALHSSALSLATTPCGGHPSPILPLGPDAAALVRPSGASRPALDSTHRFRRSLGHPPSPPMAPTSRQSPRSPRGDRAGLGPGGQRPARPRVLVP